MTIFEHRTVQPVLDDGTVDKSKSRTIEASTPLKAAEAVLDCSLTLDGRSPRALVWRMSEGYVPLSITVYDKEALPPGTPAST